MKNFFSIIKIGLLAMFGAVLFNLAGWNVLAGSATILVLSGFTPKITTGMLAEGFDISDVVTQLGDYSRKFSNIIWRKALADVQLEKYMRKVPKIQSQYVAKSSSHTEFLQAKQPGWQPKGSVAFKARINTVFQIKMDYVLENIEEIYDSYLSYMLIEGVALKDMPFPKYITINHIIPGITAEVAAFSAHGKFVEPTPGVAGNSIDSVDGILTIIFDEIFATNLTPIVTGALIPSTIVDQIDFYCDAMPADAKKRPLNILTSPETVTMYWRARRNDFGGNMDYKAEYNFIPIEGTKNKLVAIDELAGSQRLITAAPGNMICMYDSIYLPKAITVQQDKRDINMFTDFKRGYGFETLDELWVNDQE